MKRFECQECGSIVLLEGEQKQCPGCGSFPDYVDMTPYRVWCEDCDLDEQFDPLQPPEVEVRYWGNISKARQHWSAEDAAKGKRDNHAASVFRDYDEGLRHRPHLNRVEYGEEST